MNVCWRNPTSRKIAKRCKENNAKALLKDLQKRFQVIQDNVKQAETTAFNMMAIKAEETTGAFLDRLIEQADKLEDMGEHVSDLRKINRLQEGLFPKYPVLSHRSRWRIWFALTNIPSLLSELLE